MYFDRLGRKINDLEIYIKVQDKSITHPKSKICLCEFVLTNKLPLTVILKVN